MCGITGIFAFNQIGAFYMINLGKSIDLLAHRGPDGRGTYIEELIALGHRRLSIIDTVNGRQPMHDVSDRFTIIFNGEIFNYKELKEQLIKETDCVFSTDSDTEVLLNAYITWGVACLPKLNGFFAFAIYDKQKHEIFIARDRFGVKPLLYYKDEDKFIFASEMKSVLAYNVPREIDWASVRQYFTLGYIPEPNSIFKDVKKVEAGSYLLISKSDYVSKKYYHVTEQVVSSAKIDLFEEASAKVRTLIDAAVKDRLVSDVPVGAFLSGGIDSSVVVASAAKQTETLNTFSIGFKGEGFYDETKSAELAAKTFKTNHTSFILTRTDLADNVLACMESMSEPFGDTSSLPLYILSKKVSPSIKVVLSGDGADEVFGGYNKHKAEWLIKNPNWQIRMAQIFQPLANAISGSRESSWNDKLRQIRKLTQGMNLSDAERYYVWCSLLPEAEQTKMFRTDILGQEEYARRRKDILRRFKKTSNDLNVVLHTDLELVLGSDMLHKVDSMSMAHGLEIREPLIDYRLVDYVTSLPATYKVTKAGSKQLLKHAYKNELPDEILAKPKHGFDVPLTTIFSNELKTWILDELLDQKFIERQGVFEWKYINQLRTAIQKNTNMDESRVWSLIVFQFWWKKFMN